MDETGDSISGGQKKLLELARALMLDPELILLDEPAAGVNPALMDRLAAVIQRINRELGKTFLIIEHDMSLVARLCTRVTVMAAGQRLADGDYASVASDSRVIEAYLGGPGER
jgi:branched-chain amino acid transport system ATP-binding protein